MIKQLLLVGMTLLVSSGMSAQIQTFPLGDVKVMDTTLLKHQSLSQSYIMSHNPDRLLAPFRREAGLDPKAPLYGNWENTGLDGHIGGHYLTALSQLWAVTNDTAVKKRLDYMIDELALCQQHYGNGYVGGVPGSKALWDDVKNDHLDVGSFSLNGKWVPWYNLHKTFAGLRDAWVIGQNQKARDVLIQLCDWCVELCSGLSDERMELMLRAEYGGMNETLADVAALTGNDRYLQLARRFSHRLLLDPLLHHQDLLNGMHANTQIPKVIGFERVAEVAADTAWHNAAVFFWDNVVNQRSVSIGGNSVSEHFHPANDFTSMMESREGPETCNTYNMLKLSRMLWTMSGDTRYLDYYEQAMYNHILSSQHPEQGGYVYFTSMRPRHYRVYSQPEQAFWCCVGSGMENHSKYGELVYAHHQDTLYVNLFMASVLNWKQQGLSLTQSTAFPAEEGTSLQFHLAKKKTIALKIRKPRWVVASDAKISVNGKPLAVSEVNGYWVIRRTWKNGDRIRVELPMRTETEMLPDGSGWASFRHGPIVLAAVCGHEHLDGLRADDSRMGHVAQGALLPIFEAPVIIANPAQLTDVIKPKSNAPLHYLLPRTHLVNASADIELVPFHTIHDVRYQTYFKVMTPDEYERNKAEAQKREEERLRLEARTIDQVNPGQQQPESDHNIRFKDTESGIHMDRHWRHAAGWFSYDLKKPESTSAILQITYFGQDRGRSFNILINDQLLTRVDLTGSQGSQFFSVDYPIPAELINASVGNKITVRFEALPGSIAGGIYGVKLLKPILNTPGK
ncbi:MAG: glycoside hydrolase family 127 protein [Marinilabiliaceae bacterium]|nr:glycoside hydrolase family 127 protein [Marinilabiliaceae bacterium]